MRGGAGGEALGLVRHLASVPSQKGVGAGELASGIKKQGFGQGCLTRASKNMSAPSQGSVPPGKGVHADSLS